MVRPLPRCWRHKSPGRPAGSGCVRCRRRGRPNRTGSRRPADMPGADSTGLLDSRRPAATSPAQRLVQTYLDHLAVERGSSPNTLSSYRRDLRRYLDYLAGRGIDSLATVDSATVGGFLAALREGDADHPALSASSAARAVVAVRGLHKFGYADGELPSDVAREVKPPVPPRRLPKAISVEDVERLLEAA